LKNELKVKHTSDLIPILFHQPEKLPTIIKTLTIPVSKLFRNPSVFCAIRDQILPYLETFPKLTIWVAGCASGEEAYSLAILLKEEGALNKTQIFATDLSPLALQIASSGTLRHSLEPEDAKRYQLAGGHTSLSDFFTTKHGRSKLNEELLASISFQQHNLVKEAAFTTPQLLLCRNVFIYFNRDLQNKVLKLFLNNLDDSGFLVLGPKESIEFSIYKTQFKVIDKSLSIYQSLGV
jgi:chemotaxis protein methyltransferase CheR